MFYNEKKNNSANIYKKQNLNGKFLITDTQTQTDSPPTHTHTGSRAQGL